MENLLEYAKQYNQFGFNVIPLKITKEGKTPALGKWKHFQSSKQSTANIEELNWNGKVNGIGGINNKITSIDFDKCEDENFILKIANNLGINSWIVKTGFGFHLHLIIEDIKNLELMIGSKAVIIFKPKDKSKLSQCELRVRNCFTALPPSQHYNGQDYQFISGKPQNPPEKVTSQKLLDVLRHHFIMKSDFDSATDLISKDDLFESIASGVSEGRRHIVLAKYFGLLVNREDSIDLILIQIQNWNKQNKPPLDDNEVTRLVDDLWWRYSKGFNGKFHQFENILLSLDVKMEKKLKMILCYSVIEHNSDDKILNKLSLNSVKERFHKECKNAVEKNYVRTQKIDQIIRVGENLITDVIKGKVKYDYFSVYLGIISFLGRRYTAKRISNGIISYRSIGYKNFNDWFESESIQKPPSRYIINKAVEYLEEAGFLRTFSLKRGQMKFYSTRLKTKEELAEFAKNYTKKKLRRKIEEEKLRAHIQDEIHGLEREYKLLKKDNSANGSFNHC